LPPFREWTGDGRRNEDTTRLKAPANETHVSAKQNQARTHTWFSCPHGDESRAPRSQAAPSQGPRQADAIVRAGHRAVVTTADKHLQLPGSSPSRFQRNNRLADAAAYGCVFKKATRSRDRWFTVLCIDNKTGTARLGLAISKKHCRAATARNKIKRIVRESFRQHQVALAGLDIVVINKPAAATGSNRQLFDSLASHWQRSEKAVKATVAQEEE